MAKERLGVDARNFVDALNEVGVQVRKLGIDKVAAKAGLKPSIVKKFVADAMKSKTSDIRKIRNAVNEMLFPDEQPSAKTDGDTDEPSA
jgi:hypothetical protein